MVLLFLFLVFRLADLVYFSLENGFITVKERERL